MNRTLCCSAAVTVPDFHDDAAVLALDEMLGEALRGDDTALHVASYELRGRIILDITPILEAYGCEEDAEDLADDTILAIAEREVRYRRGEGEALAAVLRKARRLARQHLDDRGKRWRVDQR
jgi:DNA-directed RNA polymerase specialized sigma24 family protein